jgi:hypothetical protein
MSETAALSRLSRDLKDTGELGVVAIAAQNTEISLQTGVPRCTSPPYARSVRSRCEPTSFLIGPVPSERELWRPPRFRLQLANKAILRTEQITGHPGRPLLVIDGDSFAHRAYHGVPKPPSGGRPLPQDRTIVLRQHRWEDATERAI